MQSEIGLHVGCEEYYSKSFLSSQGGFPPRCDPNKNEKKEGECIMEGRVKWFNEKKGYGFIEKDEGGDIFVHYTNIVGDGFWTLKEGQTVRFDVDEGHKGFQAKNVRPL
jgi:CspA family cold shock protein